MRNTGYIGWAIFFMVVVFALFMVYAWFRGPSITSAQSAGTTYIIRTHANGTPQLWTLDPATAGVSKIANIVGMTSGRLIEGVAYYPPTETMYTFSSQFSDAVHTINLTDGTAAVAAGASVNTRGFRCREGGFYFQAVLYCWYSNTPPGLYSMDISTWEATRIGGDGLNNVSMMDIDGTLHAYSELQWYIYTVDTTTGARTQVHRYANDNLQRMWYDPRADTLYAISKDHSIYTVDTDTWAATDTGNDISHATFTDISQIKAIINVPPPPLPEVSITGGGSVEEGGTLAYTITVDPAPATSLTVNLVVSQTGDFVAAGDLGDKMVTVLSSGSATYSIATIDDAAPETAGTVTVAIKTSDDYDISATAGSAIETVRDDDAPPTPTPTPTPTPEPTATPHPAPTPEPGAVAKICTPAGEDIVVGDEAYPPEDYTSAVEYTIPGSSTITTGRVLINVAINEGTILIPPAIEYVEGASAVGMSTSGGVRWLRTVDRTVRPIEVDGSWNLGRFDVAAHETALDFTYTTDGRFYARVAGFLQSMGGNGGAIKHMSSSNTGNPLGMVNSAYETDAEGDVVIDSEGNKVPKKGSVEVMFASDSGLYGIGPVSVWPHSDRALWRVDKSTGRITELATVESNGFTAGAAFAPLAVEQGASGMRAILFGTSDGDALAGYFSLGLMPGKCSDPDADEDAKCVRATFLQELSRSRSSVPPRYGLAYNPVENRMYGTGETSSPPWTGSLPQEPAGAPHGEDVVFLRAPEPDEEIEYAGGEVPDGTYTVEVKCTRTDGTPLPDCGAATNIEVDGPTTHEIVIRWPGTGVTLLGFTIEGHKPSCHLVTWVGGCGGGGAAGSGSGGGGALRTEGAFFSDQTPQWERFNTMPAPDGMVTARVAWGHVSGAERYQLSRKVGDGEREVISVPEANFERRFYEWTAPDDGSIADIRVRGLASGGSSGKTIIVDGAEFEMDAGKTYYSPWSVVEHLTLETNPLNVLTPVDETDPLAGKENPDWSEGGATLGDVIAELWGGDGASWNVLAWLMIAVIPAALAAIAVGKVSGDGWLTPEGMSVGILVGVCLWCGLAPTLGGVPWAYALTPLLLLIYPMWRVIRTMGVV